jgi:flavin-dependent dehydrogenase
VALMVSRSVDGQMTRQRVSARLFVDASGLVAALRREVPSLEASCEQVGAEDLCVAAQEVRHVTDEEAAAAWLERHSASVGQTLAWTGLNGGFSVLNVRVSPGMKHVGILTGSIVGSPFPSGRRILDSFVKEEGWIGEKVFGGSRAIPLRRPYTRLISPGVALLGDAACQVFTAHGSGIGIGLIAGRMLADAAIEAVAAGEDPGSLTGLWRYPTRFHRRWGGLLASTDVFRRFSQCLSEDDLETMMSSGLISPKMASANLGQQPPKVSIQDLPKLIAAASKAPALLMRLLPVLLRAPVIEAAARTYPRLDRPHAEVALFRYERWMQWLVDSVDFGGSRSGGR